jgi:Skp family chaperone for outer membrane proteins
MIRLNSRQWTALFVGILVVMGILVSANRGSYTLKDFTAIINSMDRRESQPQRAKITNNNSPEMLERHRIEVQVNELLKKKLDSELEWERKEMKAKEQKLRDQLEAAQSEATKKVEAAEKKAKEAIEQFKAPLVSVTIEKFEGKAPEEYTKLTYSFKARDEEGNILVNPIDNELVLLSSFTNSFGNSRNYENFLDLLQGIGTVKQSKSSISLLIGDAEVFKLIDNAIRTLFGDIAKKTDGSKLTEYFSKVTLIHAPFLERKFQVARGDRQRAHVQKQRRRVLAQMRNFLVNHGIANERFSLFIDSDMIEIPKEFLKIAIESEVDIATLRVDMKNTAGEVVHPDYDLNSWAGDRLKPTAEEEEKLNNEADFLFYPRPGENSVHFLDLSQNPEKYGLDNSPSAKYELKSVGGALLFAKSNVYKQGIQFSTYYIVGTNWDRLEGWDGIETEGLCYHAETIGYKCWGFPNLVAYHTS